MKTEFSVYIFMAIGLLYVVGCGHVTTPEEDELLGSYDFYMIVVTVNGEQLQATGFGQMYLNGDGSFSMSITTREISTLGGPTIPSNRSYNYSGSWRATSTTITFDYSDGGTETINYTFEDQGVGDLKISGSFGGDNITTIFWTRS